MLAPPTVGSTHHRRRCATRWSRAICTIRSWICLTTTGPTATPAAPAVSGSWVLPCASRRGAIRPEQRVVELADVLERFLELVVIAEPPAHVINLFAAQAELASTAASIADGQNPQRVPAAASADRAAAGVAHGPLEQRAAQHLPCHRQLGDERLARLNDLLSCHLTNRYDRIRFASS